MGAANRVRALRTLTQVGLVALRRALPHGHVAALVERQYAPLLHVCAAAQAPLTGSLDPPQLVALGGAKAAHNVRLALETLVHTEERRAACASIIRPVLQDECIGTVLVDHRGIGVALQQERNQGDVSVRECLMERRRILHQCVWISSCVQRVADEALRAEPHRLEENRRFT